MKKFINRNYFWSRIFVEQLAHFGIKNVCISPGSRNTPLNLAFAKDKRFNKYIFIDERSSAFFALGIAKITQKPVVIVTTSGTAVAELYPAIIEAFQSRTPLIVCTADRPKYLINKGANQTINQKNIFKNHIRYSIDLGLPSLSRSKLNLYSQEILKAYQISTNFNPGPVHLNFQFKKPLEPNSFTDDIKFETSEFLSKKFNQHNFSINSKDINYAVDKIENSHRTVLFVGWDNFDNNFYTNVLRFSKKFNIPVFVDGINRLRFYKKTNTNIFVNHSSFLRSNNFCNNFNPTLLLQFGNAPTSTSVLNYLDHLNVKRILVNEFGDRKDPSKKSAKIIKINPSKFIENLLDRDLSVYQDKEWFNKIVNAENECEKVKLIYIKKSTTDLELSIPSKILNVIPKYSNLFISNSLPIRDFDLFSSKKNININLFTNRGASGIDGIISTAAGITSQSNQRTFLIIGDLAFFHNLTALSNLKELKIPLIIFLINNNGGGIFNLLPVSKDNPYFQKYFKTPLNLNYSRIVKSFGGNYFSPKRWNEFYKVFEKVITYKDYSVIELKIDSAKSLYLRQNYFKEIEKFLEK